MTVAYGKASERIGIRIMIRKNSKAAAALNQQTISLKRLHYDS